MAEHRKRIFNNFISLSVVQGLSIFFPLIIFPYLLQILGVEGFGVFTLIQTVIMYADLLVSFGFGLTATKHIAKNISDKEKTNNIITSVYFIKIKNEYFLTRVHITIRLDVCSCISQFIST